MVVWQTRPLFSKEVCALWNLEKITKLPSLLLFGRELSFSLSPLRKILFLHQIT
jgi:hypothetical protein